jgi:hypothetical protein
MADQKPIIITTTGQLQRLQTGDAVGIDAGGTGATTAAGARSNLSLTVGTNVQAWDADLDALAALSATGLIVRTGAGAVTTRAIMGTSGRITVSSSDGVSSNPTIDLATVTNSGTGTFYKIAVDGYGRVTGFAAVVAGDITTLVDSSYVNVSGDTMTGALTLAADPGSAMQAATKQYVDNLFASGGIPPFPAAKVATTANITLSGTQTIDGVAVIAADRVLVKNQTTTSQNGIYVVAAGAWTRATDADAGSEFPPARQVFVQQGTANANTGWAVGNSTQPVVGTDPITWTQVSGAAAYTAGNGLSLTGNVFAAVGTAGRIVVSGSGIDLASGIATAGTYTKLTVDTYGRVTLGATATAADVGAQAADSTLTALAAYNTNGLLTQTAADTFTGRTLTGSARISVTNGNGVSGNPTLDLTTSGITAGTYAGITFDTYGRATSAVATTSEDLEVSLTNGNASAIAIGRAVYSSAAGAVNLANANAAGTMGVVGLVSATSIANGAAGLVAMDGVLTATTTQWDAVTGQTGGLTFGSVYFLSNTTAGALTTTAPASGYVVPVGRALSTTQMKIHIGPSVQL